MNRTLAELKTFLKNRYRNDNQISRFFYPENPLPLEQCYISLALVTEKEITKVKQSQDSGQGATETGKINQDVSERQYNLHEYERIQRIEHQLKVNAILQECKESRKRIYIEGAAGAGKSTLSRFIVHEWGNNKTPWCEYDWVFHIRFRELDSELYAHEEDLFKILDAK